MSSEVQGDAHVLAPDGHRFGRATLSVYWYDGQLVLQLNGVDGSVVPLALTRIEVPGGMGEDLAVTVEPRWG